MTKGAFQVSREIFENEIWSDVVKFRIFFYILGKAVFSQDGIEQAGIHLERGQYLRSLRNLQDDLSYREGRGNAVKKYPLTTIQRKIKSLEKEERITTKSTEYGTLFTVVNYALYQGLDNYKKDSVEQRRNSDGTATEQQRNNNKNDKECSKKEKKDKEKRHKYEICDMTLAELLLSNIRENNPNYKNPNLEKWASDIRLMRERDNRTEDQIEYLIKWTQSHDFWQANILSPSKLREKFDTLIMQVKQERNKTKSNVIQFNREAEDDSYNYGF
ncbi:hypothetical protein [Virgibacillus salexigens]|uniref:hypothetical protein n=1 Tax=Virgibacillus salexigens TaxID=61016 RepID=UPI00190C3743|nr:hypothetical protein [Virgibacillus salexigens]